MDRVLWGWAITGDVEQKPLEGLDEGDGHVGQPWLSWIVPFCRYLVHHLLTNDSMGKLWETWGRILLASSRYDAVTVSLFAAYFAT